MLRIWGPYGDDISISGEAAFIHIVSQFALDKFSQMYTLGNEKIGIDDCLTGTGTSLKKKKSGFCSVNRFEGWCSPSWV